MKLYSSILLSLPVRGFRTHRLDQYYSLILPLSLNIYPQDINNSQTNVAPIKAIVAGMVVPTRTLTARMRLRMVVGADAFLNLSCNHTSIKIKMPLARSITARLVCKLKLTPRATTDRQRCQWLHSQQRFQITVTPKNKQFLHNCLWKNAKQGH